MATSLLGRRTAIFCWAFRGILPTTSVLSDSFPRGILHQIANYNPKPLKLNLKDPYIPDKEGQKTPEWQKTLKYDRKLYGRYGSASGIDPEKLWPSPAKLEEIIAEEREWNPSLEVMLENIGAREKELAAKRLAKEKLIAANMAKMPKMVADWRKEKRDTKMKAREDKDKRARLLAEARERFGFAIDPRSARFQEMVGEIEKEERKKKKLMKRKLKIEQSLTPVAEAPAAST
ncbi:large ribosomal subunit protein mL64 [Osmerus eperlanus]|uniref:large ribosomal subunit protein mL64 n=1 Tax=Osmerus eperlanus TaxID=29151 RepID=UPI002E15518C